MSEASPYTAEDRQRWRQAILAKGQEVSTKLEEVLAGKDVNLSDISLIKNDEPKETKEKKLRAFLDLLMRRLKLVDTPSFGLDATTGQYLSVAALNEQPWNE